MSKASILAAIRANKPGPRPLPKLPTYALDGRRDEKVFRASLAGSKSTVVARADLERYLTDTYPGANNICSRVPALIQGNVELTSMQDPLDLASVDVTVLPAQFGVAENGAIWLSEKEMAVRVLPFITQHLVLVLPHTDNIVPTMHEAYRRINIDATGFGVFIAGPSKTADIEQSLVIGAHGSRSLTVVL